MKQGSSIFISIVLVVFLFSGCGRHSGKKSTSPSDQAVAGKSTKSRIDTSTRSQSSPKEQTLKTIDKDSLSNVISIVSPNTSDIVLHQAYLHSLEKVKINGKHVLLIRGDLPDACSKLYHVNKAIDGETLTLTISTWKPKNVNCTQALKPFTFIYDGLGYFEYKSVTHYKINGKLKAF